MSIYDELISKERAKLPGFNNTFHPGSFVTEIEYKAHERTAAKIHQIRMRTAIPGIGLVDGAMEKFRKTARSAVSKRKNILPNPRTEIEWPRPN